MMRWIALFCCIPIGFLLAAKYSEKENNIKPVVEATVTKTINKASNPHVEAWVNQCAQKVGTQLKAHNVPGAALAIVYKDKVYLRTFGVKSIKTSEPINEHSVFRVGSLSKTFAGVLTAKLVKDKRIRWDNRVVDYLPEFKVKDPVQTDNIRIKHLLSHTTGLPYHTYTNLIEAGLPIADIIPKLESVNLTGSEGEIYSYQNVSFSIVAEIYRKLTGTNYGATLKEEIFNPIGMYDASTTQKAMLNNKNIALPHKPIKSGWHQTKVSKKYYNAVPAGGVNASIHDMASYIQLLLGQYPSVLSKEDLAPIFEPFIKTPVKRRYFRGWDKLDQAYYGMGWRVLSYDQRTIAYHSGFVNSYKGELMVDNENQIGFCLLMNAPSPCAKHMVPICLNSFDEYQGAILEWEQHEHP